MKKNIYPIILAGGVGSRLWPLSRANYPKQFLSLQYGKSMLQNTIERIQDLNYQKPLVISNIEYRFIVAEQLRQIDKLDNNILLEPFGRNTAPAIGLAAFSILEKDKDASLLILPADHTIDKTDLFCSYIDNAQKYVDLNKLVTFGVVPNKPETGYGYIHYGNKVLDVGYEVKSFIEKPNLSTAKKYLNSKDYLWNSGMFAFKAKTYLEELNLYKPDIYNFCKLAIKNARRELDFTIIDNEFFEKCESISIDYAIMENTSKTIVIPIDVGWSDVGAWNSVYEISKKDNNNNHVSGNAIVLNSKNNYVQTDSSLVAMVDVDDIILIQKDGITLIIPRNSSQNVKHIIDELNVRNLTHLI